jgi:hypothetical protein
MGLVLTIKVAPTPPLVPYACRVVLTVTSVCVPSLVTKTAPASLNAAGLTSTHRRRQPHRLLDAASLPFPLRARLQQAFIPFQPLPDSECPPLLTSNTGRTLGLRRSHSPGSTQPASRTTELSRVKPGPGGTSLVDPANRNPTLVSQR